MRSLSPVLLACLLAGCGGSMHTKPAIAACDAPVALPDTALSDRQVEIYWGRDRDALRTCGARVDAMLKP